jgi:hypothetical protein
LKIHHPATRRVILTALAVTALAVTAALSAPLAQGPAPARAPKVQHAQGAAHLRVFGSRSEAQLHSNAGRKFDPTLAELARHAPALPSARALVALHALNPAARFTARARDGAPLVLVDITAAGDAKLLRTALEQLGLERGSQYRNSVGGWLPVAALEAASALGEVHSLRASLMRTRSVAQQGVFAMNSDQIRASYPALDGTGVKVGVLSDSYNCYAVYAAPGSGVPASGPAGYASNGYSATAATDIATGDIPGGISVLEEGPCTGYDPKYELPFSDEGRAMMQIIHGIAPKAGLAFYTASNSETDFAAGIEALAGAGAQVITDDEAYFDEPFFQDGLIAQAVDTVAAQGVVYTSAAGNEARHAWQSVAPSFATLSVTPPNAGEYLLNFDTSGATTTTALAITVPPLAPGDFVPVIVEWDQPYVTGAPGSGGATSEINVCVSGVTGNDLISDGYFSPITCTGPNALGSDPLQIILIANPASSASNTTTETLSIMVGLAGGAPPGRVKVSLADNGVGITINQFATDSPTLQGHPGAAGAGAVGAAFYFETPRCGTSPATLESFSSAGGDPILFSSTGQRFATPVLRQKPDFVAPDGANDTFLGYTLAAAGVTGANGLLPNAIAICQNAPQYPNFFGTSAATAHAAGLAALLKQASPAATGAEILAALRQGARAMGSAPNPDSGYGLLDAPGALAFLPPGPPTLTLAPGSVAAGASTTLSWSSINATGCTATGSWTGSRLPSGSLVLQPVTVGSSTYLLSCANAVGSSAVASAQLTVTVPPSGGSGGGAIDGASLLVIALSGLLRMRRLRSSACSRG